MGRRPTHGEIRAAVPPKDSHSRRKFLALTFCRGDTRSNRKLGGSWQKQTFISLIMNDRLWVGSGR